MTAEFILDVFKKEFPDLYAKSKSYVFKPTKTEKHRIIIRMQDGSQLEFVLKGKDHFWLGTIK